MVVVMQLPQALADDAGDRRELEFDIAVGATLGELLAEVRLRHPALARRLCDETGAIRRYVNVYVGGDESRCLQGRQTPLVQGVVVLVAGSVAGG